MNRYDKDLFRQAAARAAGRTGMAAVARSNPVRDALIEDIRAKHYADVADGAVQAAADYAQLRELRQRLGLAGEQPESMEAFVKIYIVTPRMISDLARYERNIAANADVVAGFLGEDVSVGDFFSHYIVRSHYLMHTLPETLRENIIGQSHVFGIGVQNYMRDIAAVHPQILNYRPGTLEEKTNALAALFGLDKEAFITRIFRARPLLMTFAVATVAEKLPYIVQLGKLYTPGATTAEIVEGALPVFTRTVDFIKAITLARHFGNPRTLASLATAPTDEMIFEAAGLARAHLPQHASAPKAELISRLYAQLFANVLPPGRPRVPVSPLAADAPDAR